MRLRFAASLHVSKCNNASVVLLLVKWRRNHTVGMKTLTIIRSAS